jgi:hypothetical protein
MGKRNRRPVVAELRQHLVDQQHVFDASGPQLLQFRDELVGRPDQRRILIGDVGIGKARWILVALGARAARQPANGRQCLAAQRECLFPLLLIYDLQCPRDADTPAIELVTGCFERRPIDCDPLDRQFDRRDLVEQQIETLPPRAPNCLRAAGAHPERRMRLLHRARLNQDVFKIPMLAVMRKAFPAAPRLAQNFHRLVESLGRFCL